MNNNNYYYTGEFGYFNSLLLPELEDYLENNNSINITLYIFPDYSYIIKNLYSNKINCIEITLEKIRIVHSNIEYKIYKKFTPFTELIKTINMDNPKIKTIKNQITTTFKSDDNNDNYICYFPRFRDSKDINTNFKYRNSNKDECEYILNLFTKNNIKIYIVGNEVLDFDYNIYNTQRIENIEESIYYLKNCKFLISNDSGFIDFSKNCGCKKIIILKPIVNYHDLFNPFNSIQYTTHNINFFDNTELLNNLLYN